MLRLPIEFKKVSLVILIIFSLLLIGWLITAKIALILKLILLLLVFSFFLSLLLIFEAISSFGEYLFFWLTIAIIVAIFYWQAGLVIFLTMLFKLLEKRTIYRSRIKFPFSELALKDYAYLLLSLTIIINLFIYQNLINLPNLPLSFSAYSLWLGNINNIFRLNLPLEEKTSSFLENYLKSRQDKKEALFLLSMVKLPEMSLKELGYESLKNSWQNEKIRWWYIVLILLVIDTIFYPLIILAGRLIVFFVLGFIYFLKFFHLFQIETKLVNKEVIAI